MAEAVEAPRGAAGRRPPQRGRARARRGVPLALRRADLLGVVLPEADRAVARGPRALRRGARVHRGDRLDRLVADRPRGPPELHGRLQGDVVAGRRASRRASTSRRPIPASTRPARSSATSSSPLGTRAGTLTPDAAQAIGLPETVAVAVGQRRLVRVAPGRRRRAPGRLRDGRRHVDLRHGRRPSARSGSRASPASSGTGSSPGCTATRPGRSRSATCSPGTSSCSAPATRSWSASRRAIGPGETGLVALDWWNGNRSILADADLTGAILGLTLQTSARRSTGRCSSRSRSATGGSSTTSSSTGSPAREIVACGGIAERSPLLMQMFADTTGRPVHVPGSSEIPARGSALFGAVAGGAFKDIGAAVGALRPGVARTYQPDAGPTTRLRPGLRRLPVAVRDCSAARRSSCCTASSGSATKGGQR